MSAETLSSESTIRIHECDVLSEPCETRSGYWVIGTRWRGVGVDEGSRERGLKAKLTTFDRIGGGTTNLGRECVSVWDPFVTKIQRSPQAQRWPFNLTGRT